jgi:signal transduction histidine kinase
LLPNTPLVAFTADVAPGARERALASGCVGYMSKPLDADTFAHQVREFLGGKREESPDSDQYREKHRVQLVERLEAKVRELTKTAERNATLAQENRQMVAVLQRRQRLLEAAARVGRNITSILDLDELLRTTVDIICEEYNLYYSAIYLLDAPNERLELYAGHGEAGAAMLAAGHFIALDAGVAAAIAVRERKAHITREMQDEPLRNPQLSKTRSEMALPLIVQDAVLGVLSVQSDRADAIEDDDRTALQALADQIAVAIKNAQLLRDLHEAHQELVRTKTFEAIATATGEAIHWVGNKAAPIPGSARRVREDLYQILAIVRVLSAEQPERIKQHALWPSLDKTLAVAAQQGVDLDEIAGQLSALSPERLGQMFGGVESIIEDLAIIEKSATTILDIKEDLIGPARLQNVKAVSLAELLRDVIAGMGLPQGVVRTEFASEIPPVQGDARQLNRVFINLVKNAWEALHEHPQPQIDVIARAADDPRMVVVQVRDNGPGIPPEMIDKIWVTFFTTKGDRGGTGLGLAASMEIIKQSGGNIWVESMPGEGTTFTVTLPRAE